MPRDKNFTEISFKTTYLEQYKKRAEKNKRNPPRQLEFDLAMLGAITLDDSPNNPEIDLAECLEILKARVAALEEIAKSEAKA